MGEKEVVLWSGGGQNIQIQPEISRQSRTGQWGGVGETKKGQRGGGAGGGWGRGKLWACSLLLSESGAGGLLSPAPQCLGQSPPAFNMGKTFTCLLLLLPMVRTSEVQLALEKKGCIFKTWKIKIKVENKNSKF